MFPAARPFWVLLLLAGTGAPVLAQTAAASASAPSSSAPDQLGYRSTFDRYQGFTDEKVGSWRDANDTVGRIGGWRTYANEARQPARQAGDPPAGAVAPRKPAQDVDPRAGDGKQ